MRINKIIGAFGNIKQIAEGVKNKIFKKADVEQIADIRWLECSICPALDVVGKTCAVPNTQPCCSDCGCSLGLKLRALSSSCPKGKWPAIVDAKSEQLIKKPIKQKENGSNI